MELTVTDQKAIDHISKFKCPSCDHAPFQTPSGLRYHTIRFHGAAATNLGDEICPECGYKSSKNGVALHRSLKHGVKGIFKANQYRNKRKIFGCSFCEFRSGTKAGITRHTRNHHPNETGLAMIGKPTRTLTDSIPKQLTVEPIMEKVLSIVAEKIYNKLMEEM